MNYIVSSAEAYKEVTPYKRDIIEKFEIPIISPEFIDACISHHKILAPTRYLVNSGYFLFFFFAFLLIVYLLYRATSSKEKLIATEEHEESPSEEEPSPVVADTRLPGIFKFCCCKKAERFLLQNSYQKFRGNSSHFEKGS